MNVFDVMQYMTENGIHAINISHKDDSMVVHQFLDDGKVLQTVTEQSVFEQKEKAKTASKTKT